MKKTIKGLGIALIAANIVLVSFISESKQRNHPPKTTDNVLSPPDGITLNGVFGADADTMVRNFRNDTISSHKRTAIWLNISWVRHVDSIITKENGDGIRIYFAKRKDNKFNTIVIVSTKKLQNDTSTHWDYFGHTDPFFKTADARLTEDWADDYAKDPGAAMYNPNLNCSGDNCSIYTINYISCKEAKADVANFIIPGADGKQRINTYSEWFPLAFFDHIIKEFDAELTQNPTAPADGIRIYFARNIDGATNQDHKNRHNFIIVTTQAMGTHHQDYYNCYGIAPFHRITGTGDNGEQCLNNCNGAKLPTP